MRTFTMDDIPILYEDKHIIVVNKPHNIPCQADSSGDKDMLTVIKEFIKKRDDKPGNVYLALVHRLDRVTGGVMVFAKNDKSAARLSEAIRENRMSKRYLTVIVGKLKQQQGTLINYLKKNAATNMVYVATEATEGAKRAELNYRVLENLSNVISLVEVELITGRSHQIRVQMDAQGAPVFGDVRYGGDKLAKGHNLALWAACLEFNHPVTGDRMRFVSYPPEDKEPWVKFDIAKHMETYGKDVQGSDPGWRSLLESSLDALVLQEKKQK